MTGRAIPTRVQPEDRMAELVRRIEWWRTDLLYKAPEMIGKNYAYEMIRDLHEMATGEQDG